MPLIAKKRRRLDILFPEIMLAGGKTRLFGSSDISEIYELICATTAVITLPPVLLGFWKLFSTQENQFFLTKISNVD